MCVLCFGLALYEGPCMDWGEPHAVFFCDFFFLMPEILFFTFSWQRGNPLTADISLVTKDMVASLTTMLFYLANFEVFLFLLLCILFKIH